MIYKRFVFVACLLASALAIANAGSLRGQELNFKIENYVTTDLNTIRVKAGGLPAYAGAGTQAALRTELLYNKRYSLLFEGGHRWIDLRHYGLLSSLPRDLPAHVRYSRFPFPINECDARATPPPGCGTQLGF